MLITKSEWDTLLKAKKEGLKKLKIKLDFGLKEAEVKISDDYFLINKCKIPLKEKVKENFCYLVKRNKLLPVAFFSKKRNRFYKLLPTADLPTLCIGSVPMHKIKESSPLKDVYNKIRFLKIRGKVLDTCCGLGYTAIFASQNAEKVYTFEEDENVVFLAKLNPIKDNLFKNEKIIFKKADVFKEIKKFPNEFFDCIIHDPPTFKLAPLLYSLEFYNELYRVLKKGGDLYHYSPLPQKTKGKDFSKTIEKNLKRAGFKRIRFNSVSQGFYCSK